IRQKPGSDSVDYTDELPKGFRLDDNRVWQYEDTCFYHIDDYPSAGDILAIPEQGDYYFLGDKLGYSEVNYLTRIKDHYYLMAKDENRDNYIVKLSSDLSTVVEQVEFDFYEIVRLTVSDDYLIAYTHSGGSASPPAWKTGYYDKDLNQISGLGGPFTDVPEIYPRDGGETVVIKHYTNGLNLKTLTTDITNQSPALDLNQNELINVITDEDKTKTYALIRDIRSGQSSIKTLAAVVDMGSLSVGNWYDPDFKNQGLSIVEGQRNDGSHYLFVTIYIFRDGQPLWLAGTENINAPQKELTIMVGEYDGIGLFEPDTIPNETLFGEVLLQMTSCNQMAMTVTTADLQVFNIDLQRMENSL